MLEGSSDHSSPLPAYHTIRTPTAKTRICSAAILFVVTNHKMAAARVGLLVIFSAVFPIVWAGQTILFTRKNVDKLSEGEWMVEL